MKPENEKRMNEYIRLSEQTLFNFWLDGRAGNSGVTEAMRYSLSAGGKRIRPVLALEFCKVCTDDAENARYAAAAIEMIHTFSLIHDDMPCMDDDDMRRGKPSCHKEYSEAMALLAGDALENLAFEAVTGCRELSDKANLALVKELSYATKRMIDGQVVDLALETNAENVTESDFFSMYKNKTCALIECACVMGCICGNADERKILAARRYGEKLGLAFQIIDDILDVVGDEKELGKHIGSDAEKNKTTLASLVGIDKAREYAKMFTEQAYDALDEFDDNDFLKEITALLLNRKK